jgi:hypothetical protein
MLEPQQCPTCHLLNPPDAIRCDCGYDFVHNVAPAPRTGSSRAKQLAVVLAAVIMPVLVFGLLAWADASGTIPDSVAPLGQVVVIFSLAAGAAALAASKIVQVRY